MIQKRQGGAVFERRDVFKRKPYTKCEGWLCLSCTITKNRDSWGSLCLRTCIGNMQFEAFVFFIFLYISGTMHCENGAFGSHWSVFRLLISKPQSLPPKPLLTVTRKPVYRWPVLLLKNISRCLMIFLDHHCCSAKGPGHVEHVFWCPWLGSKRIWATCISQKI